MQLESVPLSEGDFFYFSVKYVEFNELDINKASIKNIFEGEKCVDRLQMLSVLQQNHLEEL